MGEAHVTYGRSTCHVWERHMSRMGEKENTYRVLVMQCEGKNRLEDIGIEGRIILRHILRK
jgi:hypothetical protein